MTFIWPSMLFVLVLVPLLVGGYIAIVREGARRAEGSDVMRLAASTPGLRRRRRLAFGCFAVAVGVLLFGLARPEMVVGLPRLEGTVVLAFDTSSSMRADDVDPTRMEAAKSVARGFVEGQPDSIEVGVVTFNNGGAILQPPSNDRGEILDAIDRVDPEGETSLGQGLFTALDAITEERLVLETGESGSVSAGDMGFLGSSVIVLLSDGENTNAPDPLEIAALASSVGVQVFPIGIGTPAGAVVELDGGFSVATALDEALLEQIAELTGGEYSRAVAETDLRAIYDDVDREFTREGEPTEITAVVAAVGMVLLLVGAVLSMAWFGRAP